MTRSAVLFVHLSYLSLFRSPAFPVWISLLAGVIQLVFPLCCTVDVISPQFLVSHVFLSPSRPFLCLVITTHSRFVLPVLTLSSLVFFFHKLIHYILVHATLIRCPPPLPRSNPEPGNHYLIFPSIPVQRVHSIIPLPVVYLPISSSLSDFLLPQAIPLIVSLVHSNFPPGSLVSFLLSLIW